MRNLLIILCIFSFFSCSKEDNEVKQQDKSLIGTWKNVEFRGLFYVNEETVHSQDVEDGRTYNFSENNIVISNEISCHGTYEYNEETLSLNFDCPDMAYSHTYDVVFESNLLVLIPNPMHCIEGCTYEYQKID